MRFDRINQLFCGFGVRAERHPAALDIGTGDVEFDREHMRRRREFLGRGDIFVLAVSADISDDRPVKEGGEPRDLLARDGVRARVLQPYGVDDARGALRDPRLRVAVARLEGGAFEGYAAEDIEVVVLREFAAEPESPAGGDDGVFEPPSEQGHRGIHAVTPI